MGRWLTSPNLPVVALGVRAWSCSFAVYLTAMPQVAQGLSLCKWTWSCSTSVGQELRHVFLLAQLHALHARKELHRILLLEAGCVTVTGFEAAAHGQV